MDVSFEEKELAYLQQSFTQHAHLSIGRADLPNASPLRERIFAQIADFAQTRELFRVAEEWYAGMRQAELELFWYRSGEIQRERLAECEGHGRWIKFAV